ncbi:MAG TPA: DUF4290 domain-containing protein [Bacteroidia bacterium]|nr:DUF4290 domain-containing protein [Bacteroidia bacterium]
MLTNTAVLNNQGRLQAVMGFLSIFMPYSIMEYNTQLEHLIIPEYGRNIQGMIRHCCTIADRNERNLCARAIIQVMGQLNPALREQTDYHHKLWDHLFIISGFKLDVDSPYTIPNAESLKSKPILLDYPRGKIRYKHYGKTIEDIIRKAKTFPEGPERQELTRQIANHLKKSYYNWNKDSVTDDIVFKNLADLSGGELKIDESIALSSHQELRGNTGKKFFHKGSKHKNHHKHKNRKF